MIDEDAYIPLDVELDDDTHKMLGDAIHAVLDAAAAELGARARLSWFRTTAGSVHGELPGPLADLLTQADRFIAQYAPEMNTDALSEAHNTLDAARALAAEQAWLTPDQIDSLAYHPIDWMTMRFYLALMPLAPQGDVTILIDRNLVADLAEKDLVPPAQVLNMLEKLQLHHLIINLTPDRPLADAITCPVTIAINPMVIENADREAWEQARSRWRDLLTD
ncbi:MAG TPA: hypothetical protein VD973_24390 [Symbiobacteriaceae bacterium]|nr:hypothetical protein [Symbiobacteriaceae bacterium]